MEEERAHDAERAAMRLRRLVVALVAVAAVAVVLAVAAFIQRDRASKARVLADQRAEEARKQTQIALVASREAEKNEREAKRQAEFASKAKKEAEEQTGIATAQRSAAEAATKRAEAIAKIATSRQLAALSVAERDKRFDRSLLLAVEALQAENTFEARESLYNALQGRPGLRSFLHTHEGSVWSVAFSPDGKTIATGFTATSWAAWYCGTWPHANDWSTSHFP